MWAAEPFAQRHGKVGLVVAELRLLALADQIEQFGHSRGILDKTGKGAAEPRFQLEEDAHDA